MSMKRPPFWRYFTRKLLLRILIILTMPIWIPLAALLWLVVGLLDIFVVSPIVAVQNWFRDLKREYQDDYQTQSGSDENRGQDKGAGAGEVPSAEAGDGVPR